jgi:hypothetical protein
MKNGDGRRGTVRAMTGSLGGNAKLRRPFAGAAR